MQHVLANRHFGIATVGLVVAEVMVRFRERAYLQAAMAVCALIASADGEVCFEKRCAIDAALDHDAVLLRYGAGEIIDVLDHHLQRLKHNPEAAREALLNLIALAGHRPERAVTLLRLAWNVITADNRAHDAERVEFETLCDLLGVDAEDLRPDLLGL